MGVFRSVEVVTGMGRGGGCAEFSFAEDLRNGRGDAARRLGQQRRVRVKT